MNAFRTIVVVVVIVTVFAAMMAFTVTVETPTPQRDIAVISAETTDAQWSGVLEVRDSPVSTAVPIYNLGILDPWWVF